MDLNEEQNKLIGDFARQFCDHSTTGHVHPTAHITDIRKLVEACIQAERKTQATQQNQPAKPEEPKPVEPDDAQS